MKKFMKDLTERAIKTAAQSALAIISTSTLFNEVDWKMVIATVALATVTSVLTSIASYNAGEVGTASLTK